MHHLIIREENAKKKKKQLETVKAVFDKSNIEYELHITDSRQTARAITKEVTFR